jgi:hypothetical protein
MSLKHITTAFEHGFTKEIGNLKIVISKALNDDIFKVETYRSLPPHDNYYLSQIEFMSRHKMELLSKKSI